MDCILYEWICKVFKLKKCLNCRFYRCGQCCFARTACQREKFNSCCDFSLNGYYDRYKEFLTKVIKYVENNTVIDSNKYIKSLQKKYLIGAYLLFVEPRYTRLWFRMEGENHYCHFTKDAYELDANVTLDGINKAFVRSIWV